ncbi:hypothetical protein KKB18_11825, partial [bacterium]|nr:hypothetical protein [bacterium]
MSNKSHFKKIVQVRFIFLFLIMSLPLLFLPGCDRPGGEDEDGNSYTYGMQISSVLDSEEGTHYIIFDMAPDYLGNDELAQITVENIIPSSSGSTTPATGGGSTIFSDETDSIHLTAYRVDYYVDGFRNIGSYVGRI